MIRYSKPRIVILIVILIALWAAVRLGLGLPLADTSEVKLTLDGARLTVHSSSDGDATISKSADSGLYFVTDGKSHRVTGDGASFRDVDDFEILVPQGISSLSFNGIGDVEISGVKAESIALSAVNADLQASSLDAEEIRLATVDGDINVVSSRVTDFTADTVNGDITIELEDAQDIQTHTVNGDISIDVEDPESYTRTISSPTLKTTLPSSGSGSLKAETINGDVEIF